MKNFLFSQIQQKENPKKEIKNKENLIKDSFIEKINHIIEKNQSNKIDFVFKKLNYLKEKSKNKYKTLKTDKEKENFINKLLNNLVKLLNEVNYTEVYNTDSILTKKPENYKEINSILNFINLNNNLEIKEGGDCNIQLYFFYNQVKEIINDNYINFIFFSDLRDNHGKLYIITPYTKYLYHRQSGHILKTVPIIWENKKINKEDNNIKNFIKTKKEIGYNQKKVTYRIGKKYFQLKTSIFGIILKIKSNNKEIPHLKIKGFKRISKIISKKRYIHYLGNKNKFKNLSYDELIKKIEDNITNENDKIFFRELLPLFNKKKIENIFGIKKR